MKKVNCPSLQPNEKKLFAPAFRPREKVNCPGLQAEGKKRIFNFGL
jgi:hypothetical protein